MKTLCYRLLLLGVVGMSQVAEGKTIKAPESLNLAPRPAWDGPRVSKPRRPENVVTSILREAEAGDPEAAALLGRYYQVGLYVPRNAEQAIAWYTKAAASGHAGALHNLGLMYFSGEGVARDRVKAHGYFLTAAEGGDAEAQFCTGLDFATGEGVAQNWAEARAWYERAAQQGHLAATTNLGNIYALGRAGEVDLKRALKCYRPAADANLAEAQFGMSLAYGALGEAGKRETWLRRSATNGYWAAQYFFAEALVSGEFGEHDLPRALRWAQTALDAAPDDAATGPLISMHVLIARILATGQIPNFDPAELYRHARIGADAGDGDAQYALGVCFQLGWGVTSDISAAVAWFELAGEQKVGRAAIALAYLYQLGTEVPRDLAKARSWLRVAADAGETAGRYMLGVYCRDGIGGPQDLPEAVLWLTQVVMENPKDAKAATALAEATRRMQAPGAKQ